MRTEHSDIDDSSSSRDTNPAEAAALRILIVASDLVTRKVAAGLLKSRGHEVQIASESQALQEQTLSSLPDVLLLDVTLTDSELEALVASIRQSALAERRDLRFVLIRPATESPPAPTGPIDRVISKPFQPNELFEAVECGSSVPSGDGNKDATPMLYDWALAVEQMDGREELLRELVEAFVIECDNLTEHIRDAFVANDQKGLQRAAHTLKGAASMFQAHPTVESARKLETLARDGQWEEARQAWTELQSRVEQLMPALSSHAAK